MPGFDFVCPMNYPNRCDLAQTEVDYLQKDEGKKIGFLMYQFRDQDAYLVEVIKNYFEPRNCHILEAKDEPGSGVKICKICRLATTSHFGIGVLSPQNYNVFLEIGLVWGQGKPILFVVDEKRLGHGIKLKDIAFDVSSHMVITYTGRKYLEGALEREMPIFLEKIKVMGLYQRALVGTIRDELERMKKEDKTYIKVLRLLLMLGSKEISSEQLTKYQSYINSNRQSFTQNFESYYVEYFIKAGLISKIPVTDRRYYFKFGEDILPILRQEAFKEM